MPPPSSHSRSDSIAPEPAERDDVQARFRRDRRKRLVDEPRVVLVHHDRDAQPTLLAERAQRLEAAEVRAHQQHASPVRERCVEVLGAAGMPIEFIEALLQEIHAIEHDCGKAVEVPVHVTQASPAGRGRGSGSASIAA